VIDQHQENKRKCSMTAQEARKTAISHSGKRVPLTYEEIVDLIMKSAKTGQCSICTRRMIDKSVEDRLSLDGYSINIEHSRETGEDGSIFGAFLQISW